MKDLKVLKKQCLEALNDPKNLLAALLFQLGGQATIEHKHLVRAVSGFDGRCYGKNTPTGLILTMEPTGQPVNDDFLNKILEQNHAPSC